MSRPTVTVDSDLAAFIGRNEVGAINLAFEMGGWSPEAGAYELVPVGSLVIERQA
jgi:hypothetical protein